MAHPDKLVQGLTATWYDYTGPSCAGITTAPLKGTYHINQVTIPNEVKGNIGLVITGFIYVPADGAYGFMLTSDDGSLLSIDGQVVVDNDGEHSTLQRCARAITPSTCNILIITVATSRSTCMMQKENCWMPNSCSSNKNRKQ